MKKILLIAPLFLIPVFYAGADNQKAIEYYIYGANQAAREILLANLNGNTLSPQEKAEANYYLGEIYFIEQKKDSAGYYYKQGQEISPDYAFNLIGEAKILLATNPGEGEKLLNEAVAGKKGKDINLQCAIAKAYLDNKMEDKAVAKINEVKAIDTKSPALYLVQGDLAASKQDIGSACGHYEQAIYFDPQCKEAYIKYARMYAGSNFNLAIEMLQKLIRIDTSSMLPYREIGEIYYRVGRFAEAAKAYGKYIGSDPFSFDDYPKYASILFYNKEFDQSVKIVQDGLKRDPGNFILNRLLMYDYYEQKNYPEGIKIADNFMKTNEQNIALDHIYYAKLLIENDRDEEALQQYEEAIKADPSKVNVYKDLAELYEGMEQYDKACDSYASFLKDGGSQVTLADYLALGKINYTAASDSVFLAADPSAEKKQEYCRKADSLFHYVAEKAPDSYLGNFWQARTNSLLDPETEKGLAKPYYEAAAGLLLKNENKDTRLLVECYSYLGYYYYLQNQIPESKKYWSMILELDPANAIAAEALKGM